MAAPNFIYQDDHIFAVNKPAGMHSVGLPKDPSNSVANWLTSQDPRLSNVGKKAEDGGLINRLDHDTSGILLGAKSREVYDKFQAMLMLGEIDKQYLILVEGKLVGTHAIKSWLGSPNRRAKKVRSYKSKPSKPVRALAAETTMIGREYLAKERASLVSVSCATARRHQIRAHAASLGHPLVGDTLYGSARQLAEIGLNSKDREFLLHAESTTFRHPVTGENISLQCPLDLSR